MTHKVPTLSILWTQIQTSTEQNNKLKVENNQKYSENLPQKSTNIPSSKCQSILCGSSILKRISNPDFDIVKFIWRFDWGEDLGQFVTNF
jgi:hypothetical protein